MITWMIVIVMCIMHWSLGTHIPLVLWFLLGFSIYEEMNA